jgi:hypothetical protein
MIECCKGWGVDTGDVPSLLALRADPSIAAYDRAPLPVIVGGDRRNRSYPRGPPMRRQPTWRAAAALECRQADRDRSRCVPATLSLAGCD